MQCKSYGWRASKLTHQLFETRNHSKYNTLSPAFIKLSRGGEERGEGKGGGEEREEGRGWEGREVK